MLLTYAWLLEDIHSLINNHQLKFKRKLNIGTYFVTADFVNFYQTFRRFFCEFSREYASPYRCYETKQGLICRDKPRFIITLLHASNSWRKRGRKPIYTERIKTTYILYSSRLLESISGLLNRFTNSEPVFVILLRSPVIDFPAWRNRFLGSLNVYKYGLSPDHQDITAASCQYQITGMFVHFQALLVYQPIPKQRITFIIFLFR